MLILGKIKRIDRVINQLRHFDKIYCAEYNVFNCKLIEINPENVRNSDNYRSERRAIAGRSFRENTKVAQEGRRGMKYSLTEKPVSNAKS